MKTILRGRHWLGIIIGGMAAAILDIIYAIILTVQGGHSAIGTLKAIASGVLGASAFKGGVTVAALGLFLHCAILVIAAAIYYAVSIRFQVLRTCAILCGLLFGVLVYLFMNFVVLPLSAVPFKITYTHWKLVQGFISHALLVGLPIALTIRHFVRHED